MAKYKLLFVDDEENILKALKRLFFKNDEIEVITAPGPEAAAKILRSTEIDLLVSDEKMPNVSGSQFIKYVKEKYPKIVRMILTGYANTSTVISAINKGEVYRYITKPWDDNELRMTIQKALEYAALKKKNEEMGAVIRQQNSELKALNAGLEARVSERTDQLHKALTGLENLNDVLKENFQEVVLLLTGVISLFQKDLGAHSKRVAGLTELICDKMNVKADEKELIISSALLHDLGLAGANNLVLGQDPLQLRGKDKQIYYQHPVTGASIVGSAKTLSEIAAVIRSHHEEFSSQGFPDGLGGRKIPLGSRIIKIASDYDDFLFKMGLSQEEAAEKVTGESGASFDPEIVSVISSIIDNRVSPKSDSRLNVKIKNFNPGMYLDEDVILSNGVLFLPKGILLNQKMVDKISSFSSMLNLEKEIRINIAS